MCCVDYKMSIYFHYNRAGGGARVGAKVACRFLSCTWVERRWLEPDCTADTETDGLQIHFVCVIPGLGCQEEEIESDDLLSFATSPKILINDNFIIGRWMETSFSTTTVWCRLLNFD